MYYQRVTEAWNHEAMEGLIPCLSEKAGDNQLANSYTLTGLDVQADLCIHFCIGLFPNNLD